MKGNICPVARKRPVFLFIIIAAALLAGAGALLRATRPDVAFVVDASEEPLLASWPERGLFSPYDVEMVVYPAGIPASDYYIYSPVAALKVLEEGASVPAPSACWGLSDTSSASEVFTLVFTPSPASMWSLAYDNLNSEGLLSATLRDSISILEGDLAALAPSLVLDFSYEGSLNSVTAEEMARELDANGVSTLIVFTPSNVSRLLRADAGYRVITDKMAGAAFRNGQAVDTVGEDFTAMLGELAAGSSGAAATPYVFESGKNSLEVLLDDLL